MFFKLLYNLGDKLEDKVRGKLSHFPIIYAFIGGFGAVIFWRGVWHSADSLMEHFFSISDSISTTSYSDLPWWDGPLSILLGGTLLLTVGLFVSNFIGNEIIISGLKKEKKLVEKTEDEIELDIKADNKTNREIHEIDIRLKQIEKILKKK